MKHNQAKQMRRYLVVQDLKLKVPMAKNGKILIQYNDQYRTRSYVASSFEKLVDGYVLWKNSLEIEEKTAQNWS